MILLTDVFQGLILLQGQGLPSEAWELTKITPYNPLAYGAVLLILAVGNLIFYRNWKEEVKYNRERDVKVLEFEQKVLSLMTKVEMRLSDQRGHSDSIKDISIQMKDLLKEMEELKDLIKNSRR